MDGAATSPDLFLARRAAAGHPDAWEQLIANHGQRLFNLAFQFAGSREEAEDLTQEIFLRLYANLRSYRGDVPLVGWALRLSRNLCIDHYRKTRAERGWHRVAEAVLDELPSSLDLAAESERRERLEMIYEALGELPEEYSEAVLLCDLQGWTMEEASAYLDSPLGTVKSRLFRGRHHLAEKVRARLGGSPANAAASEGGRLR